MTFNFASLQHIAVSAIGAIVTATLFISAAVGPGRSDRLTVRPGGKGEQSPLIAGNRNFTKGKAP
jgi:hypothetical protein